MRNQCLVVIYVVITVVFLTKFCEADESVCYKNKTETKYRDEVEIYTEAELVEEKCKRSFTNPLKTKMCMVLKNVTKERVVQKPYEVTRVVKVCCHGFERLRNKCVPVCQQMCENGKCTGPDTCTCNEGYTHFNTYRCVPACDNCNHGLCIAPGTCDCYSGYASIDGGCHPICDPPCEYGVCVEPNVCDIERSTTEKHYIKLPVNIEHPEELMPELKEPEIDDYDDDNTEIHEITSPKTTSTTTESSSPTPSNPCFDGYALDATGTCRLQCEIDCHYGTYEHGSCICNEGFRNSPVNPCICEPHCDDECVNGLCTGNNTCLCDEGYNLNPEDNFICLDSNTCHCRNGDCTDADHCACWKGYELKYSERNYHRCEPLCGDPSNPEGCVNGKCVAPFLCQCDEGFIHGPYNNFTCYANMDCEECLKNNLNCLPVCYTTTSTTTTTVSTSSITFEEESVEMTTETITDEYDYETNETLSEYDKSAPIMKKEESESNKLMLYIIIIAASVSILVILIIIVLRRINKPIDYDVNQREHSENNVYFIKRNDDVKLDLDI